MVLNRRTRPWSYAPDLLPLVLFLIVFHETIAAVIDQCSLGFGLMGGAECLVEADAVHITGRLANLTALSPTVSYVEHGTFDEVRLAHGSELVALNSVVLVPDMLTLEECSRIVADVQARHSQAEAAWQALFFLLVAPSLPS